MHRVVVAAITAAGGQQARWGGGRKDAKWLENIVSLVMHYGAKALLLHSLRHLPYRLTR